MIVDGFFQHYQFQNINIWTGAKNGTSFTDGTNITAWQVPKQCTMIHIFAMGGGGGGGTGRTQVNGNTRGGGGGGGGGATMSLIIPRICVTDTLYIGVGAGGAGGPDGGAQADGSTGSPSYVNIFYSKGINTNTLAQANPGAGGGGLQTTTGGGGGAAGTALSTLYWAAPGVVSSIAGTAGVAGGAGLVGTSITHLASSLSTGGSGGGGINLSGSTPAAGGQMTIVFPISPGAQAAFAGGAVGAAGLNGVSAAFDYGFFPTCGTGAGGSLSPSGNFGGDGSYGCGGGGGGARVGTQGTNSGGGGSGGPGMVVITWW